MDAPCKDCIERVLGCHAQREKYKNFVYQRIELSRTIRRDNEPEIARVEAQERMKKRSRSQFMQSQRSGRK